MEYTREEIEERKGTYITESRAYELIGNSVEDLKDAFIEDRYPSEYRDEKPVPEDYREGLTITAYLIEEPREVVMRVTDEWGNGDGTGLFYT